ncbi:unnamed protein product, partial [Effrenium voratum]
QAAHGELPLRQGGVREPVPRIPRGQAWRRWMRRSDAPGTPRAGRRVPLCAAPGLLQDPRCAGVVPAAGAAPL